MVVVVVRVFGAVFGVLKSKNCSIKVIVVSDGEKGAFGGKESDIYTLFLREFDPNHCANVRGKTWKRQL